MTEPPLIVGLNHPSGESQYALWPVPPGCAGWRLWKMVHDVSGITRNEWVAATRRVNLLDVPVLPRDYRGAARRRGRLLQAWAAHRTVVLLGREVARAVGHESPNFVWAADRDWVSVPHPSGRCRDYNDPAVRAAAGLLLADVLRACGAFPGGEDGVKSGQPREEIEA